MTIIRSNPNCGATVIDNRVVGKGDITLNVTLEQLQLISAFLMITRLGHTVYKSAATDLLDDITRAYDEVFLDESMRAVNPQVTVEDDGGMVVLTTDDLKYFPTIEVT